MALADEDHKYLNEQFTRVFDKIDQVADKIDRDGKERDMQLRQRVSTLEQLEKHSSNRITVIESKAEVTGALAGRKEGVKWSVILTLALQLGVYVAKMLFGG